MAWKGEGVLANADICWQRGEGETGKCGHHWPKWFKRLKNKIYLSNLSNNFNNKKSKHSNILNIVLFYHTQRREEMYGDKEKEGGRENADIGWQSEEGGSNPTHFWLTLFVNSPSRIMTLSRDYSTKTIRVSPIVKDPLPTSFKPFQFL